MKCPRCGGDMSSGVCENCGFPVTRWRLIRFKHIAYIEIRK